MLRSGRLLKHLQSSACRGMCDIPQGAATGVVVSSSGTISRLVTLDRPAALNALDQNMVDALTPLYQKWHEENNDLVIVMKGAGEKAFCAGGDIRAIYDFKMADEDFATVTKFFKTEYVLNQLIGTQPENVAQVSILNGITMGGGVGLSVHGKYRVATDDTLFAMPETHIGLFPDVGGSYVLPRLPHNLGMYLALTGDRIKGPDVLHAGIATHFVEKKALPDLEQSLLHITATDELESILEKFAIQNTQNSLEEHLPKIATHFGDTHENLESVLASLASDGSEWAQKRLKSLNRASPTSMKVTFRQIREGLKKSFGECFEMEWLIVQECMRQKDFFEGVRALLVDKDKSPVWSPVSVDEVSESAIERYFTECD